eukprot:1159911-Pelagomonas_calceolata.AAC.3
MGLLPSDALSWDTDRARPGVVRQRCTGKRCVGKGCVELAHEPRQDVLPLKDAFSWGMDQASPKEAKTPRHGKELL